MEKKLLFMEQVVKDISLRETKDYQYDQRTGSVTTLNSKFNMSYALEALSKALVFNKESQCFEQFIEPEISEPLSRFCFLLSHKPVIGVQDLVKLVSKVAEMTPIGTNRYDEQMQYRCEVGIYGCKFNFSIGESPKFVINGQFYPASQDMEVVNFSIRLSGKPQDLIQLGEALQLGEVWATAGNLNGVTIRQSVDVAFEKLQHWTGY
jgi:hypothetical protein